MMWILFVGKFIILCPQIFSYFKGIWARTCIKESRKHCKDLQTQSLVFLMVTNKWYLQCIPRCFVFMSQKSTWMTQKLFCHAVETRTIVSPWQQWGTLYRSTQQGLYVRDALTFAIAVHLVHLRVRFTDGPQLWLLEYTLKTHTETKKCPQNDFGELC